MMKARVMLVSAVALLLAATLSAADIKLEGVKCLLNPKGDAKADNAVDYKGGKVFFCCGNCPKKFSEDPEKFSTKANHQLYATGQAKAVKCPLTGRPLNAEQVAKVGGVDVTFCCPGCKGKVSKAEGDEQLNLVFSNAAFEKGFKVEKAEKADK